MKKKFTSKMVNEYADKLLIGLTKEETKMVENARLLMMSELANAKNEIAMQVYKVRTSSKQKIYNLYNRKPIILLIQELFSVFFHYQHYIHQ